jgi:hypothetical protein
VLFTLSLANGGGSELGKWQTENKLGQVIYSLLGTLLDIWKTQYHSRLNCNILPVLRIHDPDFGSGFFHPGTAFYNPADPDPQHWIDKYFYPKQSLLSSRKYGPRCLGRVADPDFIMGHKACPVVTAF